MAMNENLIRRGLSLAELLGRCPAELQNAIFELVDTFECHPFLFMCSTHHNAARAMLVGCLSLRLGEAADGIHMLIRATAVTQNKHYLARSIHTIHISFAGGDFDISTSAKWTQTLEGFLKTTPLAATLSIDLGETMWPDDELPAPPQMPAKLQKVIMKSDCSQGQAISFEWLTKLPARELRLIGCYVPIYEDPSSSEMSNLESLDVSSVQYRRAICTMVDVHWPVLQRLAIDATPEVDHALSNALPPLPSTATIIHAMGHIAPQLRTIQICGDLPDTPDVDEVLTASSPLVKHLAFSMRKIGDSTVKRIIFRADGPELTFRASGPADLRRFINKFEDHMSGEMMFPELGSLKMVKRRINFEWDHCYSRVTSSAIRSSINKIMRDFVRCMINLQANVKMRRFGGGSWIRDMDVLKGSIVINECLTVDYSKLCTGSAIEIDRWRKEKWPKQRYPELYNTDKSTWREPGWGWHNEFK